MLGSLQPADAATLTGKEFFPQLISGPFHDGLVIVFGAAAAMSVVGAIASLIGGGSPVEREQPALAPVAKGAAPLAAEG